MKRILFIFVISMISTFMFSQSENKQKPKTLNECYAMLDNLFSKEIKEQIIHSSDSNIMSEYHFSWGMYIRNNWIHHGNEELSKQINYKSWMIGVDDVSAVILEGYWYYLHKLPYDWSRLLESADKYYKSCDEPNKVLFPQNTNLENSNIQYFVSFDDHEELIHVYKDKLSGNYYLYSYTYKWIILDDKFFNKFASSKEGRKEYFLKHKLIS